MAAMEFKTQLSTIILLFMLVYRSDGLKCYTCSCTENDADTSCADDVLALGDNAITDCDKKFCTITRLDYKDPKGKLSSITRNCVDKVPADGVTEDTTFRTYQRSCKTDLCNDGSGKGSSSEGKSSFGDKSTIYVPGTGTSGSITIYPSSVLLGFAVAHRIILTITELN